MSAELLRVDNLHVEFATYGGTVQAVRGVDFSVETSQTLAIVGESGCGKSVAVQSIMGLLPMPPARITAGSALLHGEEIIGRRTIGTGSASRVVCGNEIGMIFQDPMSALNPTMRIGDQIAETLQVHRGLSRRRAFADAVDLLQQVRIPEAEKRARQYPFEFSGGMLQRAMIAMAIACRPSLLIADEPTTALDVTIQAQILDLLLNLQQETGMAIILITHDLGVVARMADKVAVMYAGRIVESGEVDEVFYHSGHPYTLGLKQAMPSNRREANAGSSRRHVLQPIEGSPPDLFAPPSGCAYCDRCPQAMAICDHRDPDPFQLGESHFARCWLHHPQQQSQSHELSPATAGTGADGDDHE
ncbi:MAG: ABC transporter ATP-binding protein [Pseudomonadales bacterium]|nr:ABC transporter ATP-binding protein [Pseudomonadales bacterium]